MLSNFDLAAITRHFKASQSMSFIPLPTPPKPIYTGDLETDPFAYGQMIQPFAAGFYDGQDFTAHWGKDCVAKFFTTLQTKPAGIVYFHNLGGFDFFWMLKYFTGETMIRSGRIVSTQARAANGAFHEIRDSYAIMPFPLADYKKDGHKVKLDIDINKLSARNRLRNRTEILSYLRVDCVSLHELVTRFQERFGDKLTIGTTAMCELQKLHDFIRIDDPSEDETIRDQFFYGGRVQCFEGGIIKAPLKVYDVNSMYPFVMRNYSHPISRLTSVTQKITKETCFVVCEGRNYGAFPMRDNAGGLQFNKSQGTFGVTIHEWDTARRLGIFDCRRIVRCYNFKLQRSFATFVDRFYSERKTAKESGDDVLALFYKYILNSSYGKFAQDSAKYFDYQIKPIEETLVVTCQACIDDTCTLHWRPDMVVPDCGIIIWKRTNSKPVYYNVATGCSITGAARAVLMEAIHKADHAVYCDTDSLICEELPDFPLSDSELGAWKLEAEGDMIAIAGRKLYALYRHGRCVKQANKGVRIKAKDIRFLAKNPEHEITWKKQAPSLHTDGSYSFMKRTVSMTI